MYLPTVIIHFLDQLQDLVFTIVLDPSPMAIFTNAALVRFTGINRDTLPNHPEVLRHLIHKDDWQDFLSLASSETPKTGKFRLLSKDGHWANVEGNFSRTDIEAGLAKVVQVIMRPNQPAEPMKAQDDALDQVAEIGRYLGQVSEPAEVYQRLGESVQRICPKAAAVLLGYAKPKGEGYKLEYARVGLENIDRSQWVDIAVSPAHLLDALYTTRVAKTYGEVDKNEEIAALTAAFPFLDTFSKNNSSALLVPLLAGDEVAGWLLALSSGVNAFTSADTSLVTAIANLAGSLLQTVSNHDLLTEAYDKTIEGWGTAVEIRDHESMGHSVRVAELTVRLAKRLGISGDNLVNIRRGALMHDIGKLGVPDSILLKAGPLDIEEIHEMRKHPQHAFEMLKNIGFMKDAIEIPYSHHERWDGTGYPLKLKGNAIPIAARIFSLVDVYDSMLSNKPYRRAWSINQVIDYIELNSGSMFDPRVAKEFVSMILEDNRERRRQLAEAESAN